MDTEIPNTFSRRRETLLRNWLGILGPFLGLFLVIALFAALTGSPEKFLSPFNVRIVLSQTVIVAISAIGMTLIIIGGGIDLSVGSAIALSAVVTALAINAGFDPVAAVILGIAIGGIVGFTNGLVITRLASCRLSQRLECWAWLAVSRSG